MRSQAGSTVWLFGAWCVTDVTVGPFGVMSCAGQ